jgi:adenylylsulfate kinase
METRRRSILKAISWRAIATLITVAVVYMFTGEVKSALTVGLADTTIKFGAYFFHERTWSKIRYGIRPPEDRI